VHCGPCQQRELEENWNARLRRARTFLEEVRDEERGAGVQQEIARLVEALEEECQSALWESGTRFPHSHKEGRGRGRLKLGYFEKTPSPLGHEVLPADVPDPPDIVGPEHPDYHYDWDYVASTDPLHPVDVNYGSQFDDTDHSWLAHHFSGDELEEPSSDAGFDAAEAETLWAADVERMDSRRVAWNEGTCEWDLQESSTITMESAECNSGCHSQRATPPSYSTRRATSPSRNEQNRTQRIVVVVNEFWRTVNTEELTSQPPRSPTCDPTSRLHNLHISIPSETPLALPPTPPHLFTDGACDDDLPYRGSLLSDHPSPPPSPHNPHVNGQKTLARSATSPPPDTPDMSSTRTIYDKWRKHISKHKETDRTKYNSNLLQLSRCEIRYLVGLACRFLPDPQQPREETRTNGWWR
jgi:hypothetical protein